MNTNAFNLLVTVSGPRRMVDYFTFAIENCIDRDHILNMSWAAAAVEGVRSGEREMRLADQVRAGAASTYALVCSRSKTSGKKQGKSAWHLKSESDCAPGLTMLTKWFPELDIVVVEQQTLPSAGPLFYLTYYTGERHIEYRMSKSEANRRAMPGPRTPPPCPKTIKPRANRRPEAVQACAG